jgi:hypothetical protein
LIQVFVSNQIPGLRLEERIKQISIVELNVSNDLTL